MGYAVRFFSGDVRLLSGAMVLAASALRIVTSAASHNATTRKVCLVTHQATK